MVKDKRESDLRIKELKQCLDWEKRYTKTGWL